MISVVGLFCQHLFNDISWDLNKLIKEETQAKLTTLENNQNQFSFKEQTNYWMPFFHCTTHKQAVLILEYCALQRFFKLPGYQCNYALHATPLKHYVIWLRNTRRIQLHSFIAMETMVTVAEWNLNWWVQRLCVLCVQLNHIKFLHWSMTTDSCGALASAARHYFHIMSLHLRIPSALMPSRHSHTPYWYSTLLMCNRIRYLTILFTLFIF